MALKAATLASIAGLLKVDVKKLGDAIKDEKEVDVEGLAVDTLQVFTTDELTTRDTNLKETAKSGHINAGKEIAIKELKEKTGIEIAGKDPDKFLEAYKEKIVKDAKLPVDAKVTELETQNNLLKKQLTDKDLEITTAKGQTTEAQRDSRILASLPKDRNPDISDADYLILLKSRVKTDVVDGKEVYKDDKGEVIRGKDAAPKGLGDVIGDVFTANKAWVKAIDPKAGRGGGSTAPGSGGAGGGGKATKYSEAVTDWQAQGKHINSPEFATYLGDLQKENKDFEMDLQTATASANAGSGI